MFNHDGLPSLNQDGLRNLGNILDFPPASSVLPGSHFAAYPIEEPELFIRAACPPDGIVLDPFTGTGTTLVAARKLSRRAIGIEASPEFVAGCVERLRRGDKALRDLPELKAETAEQPVLL
jgi:DNA modification methylase